MKNFFITLGVFALIIVVFIFSLIGLYNSLNTKYQDTNGAKSLYSSALNNCSEKIKGVWEISSQYNKHESSTFVAVTEARSAFAKAANEYAAAQKAGNIKNMTTAADATVKSALAFQVQIEAYPELKAAEISKENIRNMEEAVNQIKTALDDWVAAIKAYNTYRGSFFPSMFAPIIASKFPTEIEYYEGKVTALDVNSLNPEKSDTAKKQ